MTSDADSHQFVFIGGLHRSGTSLLHRCLRSHPEFSGFADLGVREDEGQFVQSVYRPARDFGGPGRFAFNPDVHLTEDSPLVTEENRRRLYADWARHWQTNKRFLLEKSPPNIIWSRFLEAMFPGSRFVFVVRHPLATSLATARWHPYLKLGRLLEHWVRAHETLHADRKVLQHSCIMKFERFVKAPRDHLDQVSAFLQVESPMTDMEAIDQNTNAKYFLKWKKMVRSLWHRRRAKSLVRSFESRVNRFGYSLADLDADVQEECVFDYMSSS